MTASPGLASDQADRETAPAPSGARAPGGPAPAPAGDLTPGGVLALQRSAGNRAVGRVIARARRPLARKLDDYTEFINAQADPLTAAVRGGSEADLVAAFATVKALSMRNLLDVMGVVYQRGDLHNTESLLMLSSRLGDFDMNRVQVAIDAVRGKATDQGDRSRLPEDQQDLVRRFGPAAPGTTGDDPEGNTYVVYAGPKIHTYFGTKVEKKRRSSVWLANNPGNSDEIGGLGLGEGMKWGIHHFAIFATMDAGKEKLWEKVKTFNTLGGHISTHLGCKADGTCPEGNDPAKYLEHIRIKAPWAERGTKPGELDDAKKKELLEGYVNAESSGTDPGATLTPKTAVITADMSPVQQKSMALYMRLLGVRSPEQ